MRIDRALVIADSEQAETHLEAWRRIGIPSERGTTDQIRADESLLIDVCPTPLDARRRIYAASLQAGASVLTTQPVAASFRESTEIANKFRTRGSKFMVLDTLGSLPAMLQAKKRIHESGEIGNARLLRIESFVRDERLREVSLLHGLIAGIRSSQMLLGIGSFTRVFAGKIVTNDSKFFVAVANFGRRATAHIVAGSSSREGKLDFAVNGTKGMLSFSEVRTLQSRDFTSMNSDSLEMSLSTEALCGALSNVQRIYENSRELKKQQILMHSCEDMAEAIMKSSREDVPVSLSFTAR